MTQKKGIYTDCFIRFNLPNPINLWFIFLFFSFSVFASDDFPPRANRLVTDFTGTLSASEQNQLESKLVYFNDSTSTQIAVVILKSIGEYEVNDYAVQLANKWGIGQKSKNNGILVLLAMETHDVSIQIGYGLEGASPDVLAKRIIENEMIPYFKQGDFYTGLDKGTDALMALVKGEYKADKKMKREKFPMGLIVFIIFFTVVILARAGRTRSYARTNHIPFWTAWWLLSQTRGRQRGSWGGFSGGGGFGGGGFGGFGGGGFGGGGASGRW